MTNTDCHQDAAAPEALFVENFSGYDYVVAPSGSCVHQVRVNITAIEQTLKVRTVREKTFELTEFLHDILKVSDFPWAHFPHKVGLHYDCNSLRGINLASPSEIRGPAIPNLARYSRKSRASNSLSRRAGTDAADSEVPSAFSSHITASRTSSRWIVSLVTHPTIFLETKSITTAR